MNLKVRCRHFLMGLLCLVGSYGCQSTNVVATKHTNAALIETVQRNTVRLCTYGSCGTGLILKSKDESKYYLLSVLHLAADHEYVGAAVNPNHVSKISIVDSTEILKTHAGGIPARTIAYKESVDLILYELDPSIETTNETIETLSFDTRKLKRGDQVFAVGNPSSFEDVYSEGYISKPGHHFKNGAMDCTIHFVDIYSSFGGSGSGVFDKETGDIVGIVSMLSTDGKQVCIITSEEVHLFLQEYGLESHFDWK